MGNLCCSSENRPEPKTTVAVVSPVTTMYPSEPSSKLEENALKAPKSKVPELDSNFDMDQVENNQYVKIVVVGEPDVGKTCAIQAYMDGKYVTKTGTRPPSPQSTQLEGVEHVKVHDIYTPAQPRKSDVYNEKK